jgi:multicomponent Na+:H+ antiporter subunit D
MSWNAALPLLVLASSFLPGLIIFFLPEKRRHLRTTLNLAGAVIKLVLIGFMLRGVARGEQYLFRHVVLPGLELDLHGDALALLFVSLSAALWFLTTVYAIGYMEGSPHRSRFFGFFSLCVTATVGVAMAGNLFTFFFFYELLTLSTYPLVVHRGTPSALRAGNVYLMYTLTGGAVLLIGVVWLYGLLGRVEFVPGGTIAIYFFPADRRHWRQGGTSAASRLATACHGSTGASIGLAARGSSSQSRRVRRRARGL